MSPRRPPRSKLPRRRLRRESDGSLYDVDERRRIELAELADDVRAGRFFRAARASSGEECTQEVLTQVLTSALPGSRVGGAGIGSLFGTVLGAMVNGAATAGRAGGALERGPEVPRNRTARSTGQHDWWEGD